MRFTDRSIAALKPKADRYEIWEDGRTGLGIRVASSGRKSFIYMYRFDGKPRRMTLGLYPKLSLANAHVLHAKATEVKERGVDPGAAHVAQRQAERSAETIEDLIDEYLEKYARPNKRSADADERALRKEVGSIWGRRKASSISRRDIIKLLDDLVDRGSPVMANRLLAAVRRMFAFAVERDILSASPCIGVRAPTKETPRDRVLSATELREFWNGLDAAKMSQPVRLALRFMLVTLQRRVEVMEASWAEFDLTEKVWEIPAQRTKNNQAHQVPLSSLAIDLLEEIKNASSDLEEIKEAKSDSDWLFPSPRGNRPMAPEAASHALRNNLKSIGVERVTPHDLRRTGASNLTAMGVPRLVVSKLLNHAEGGVTSIYDRYQYFAEKRHALDSWGTRLMEIVSGKPAAENVVKFAAVGEPK
jgi:integrase